MRAPETIAGLRVVADSQVLDDLRTNGSQVLRFADDEAFVVGGTAVLGDHLASISELETGFVGWWLTPEELRRVVHHVEWTIPPTRPVLVQGLVAGVPARLWLTEDRSLLLVSAAYAHELVERLP